MAIGYLMHVLVHFLMAIRISRPRSDSEIGIEDRIRIGKELFEIFKKPLFEDSD